MVGSARQVWFAAGDRHWGLPGRTRLCAWAERLPAPYDPRPPFPSRPGPGGRALADEFRAALPEMKVLFMSGYSRDDIVYDGRLEQGVRLLGKPFTANELLEKVREVV